MMLTRRTPRMGMNAALVLALVWVAVAAPAADRMTEPGKKFVYKQSAGVPQELEVYYPPGWKAGGPKVPGVLLFHGGAWAGGDLSMLRPQCAYLASRGLVAVTANYRMLKRGEGKKAKAGVLEHKRVCITDAKSAIRWVKQHADELGIDPQRLIVGGGSAGGHIAVLATTNPGLDDPQDAKACDTSVAAYVLFNPAFSGKDSVDSEVDVQKYLTAKFPPTIMFYGTKDSWKIGGDDACKLLKKLGNTTTEMWTAEGQNHSFFNKQPWQDLTIAAADRFLVERGLLKGSGSLAPPASGEKLVKAP